MVIEMIKCHGSGNDFLLIDEMNREIHFTEKERTELAKSLCGRKTGVGADGILFVMNSSHADAKMRIFNADGSEASMCGNGLRCVARYVCEGKNSDEAVIETMKADLAVKKQKDLFPEIPTYQVEISPVSFQLEDLPLNLDRETLFSGKLEELSAKLSFTALAVPNPHLVSIVNVEQIRSDEQKKISEFVNGPNDLFPDGVNVSFVVPFGKGQIYVRTFERGVGFTNACGTAMSASTLVTCLEGWNEIGDLIDVYNDGGKVRCSVLKEEGKYKIALIGNATFVHRLKVEWAAESGKSVTIEDLRDYGESDQYAKLQREAEQVLFSHLIGSS